MTDSRFSDVEESVSLDTEKMLRDVLERYGTVSSWKLSSLSHDEFSSKKARKGLKSSDNGNVKMSLNAMMVDATHKLAVRKAQGKRYSLVLEGITITIEETRQYFRDFTCELLTSNPKNKDIIREFSSQRNNNTLGEYLKNKAWDEDLGGETGYTWLKILMDVLYCFFHLNVVCCLDKSI